MDVEGYGAANEASQGDSERRNGLMFALTDRSWSIKTPEFEGRMRDYNWEVTYADERLAALHPEFHYSGNAYYIVTHLCHEMGWAATELPRLTLEMMG